MFVYGNNFYKRGFFKMTQDGKETQDNDKIYFYFFGKKITIISIFIFIVLPIIVSVIANIIYNNYFLNQSVKTESSEPTINTIIEHLNEIDKTLELVDGRLKDLEDSDKSNPQIQFEGDNNTITFGLKPFDDNLISISRKSVYLAYAAAAPSWENSDVIAIDSETGQEYTAEELTDQKILLSYKTDNKEYYFYGQYNENNQWDGNCITNVYEGNNLISIMDAEYQNGEVKEYRQAIRISVSSGEVWAISDRENKIDNITKQLYTTGETWNYFYNNCEYIKAFDIDNVSNKDIIIVSDFKDYIIERTSLEGYYKGRTSDGLYNDETGTAYMVRYFKDGTIRLLYVGNFIDGFPYDISNNAWSIAYSDDGGYYVHNTQGFKKGNAIIRSTNPIDINEINNIISGYNFNCDLNWKQN